MLPPLLIGRLVGNRSNGESVYSERAKTVREPRLTRLRSLVNAANRQQLSLFRCVRGAENARILKTAFEENPQGIHPAARSPAQTPRRHRGRSAVVSLHHAGGLDQH